MKKKKKYLEINRFNLERLGYRVGPEHYELLSRWAYDTRHNSIQRIIDERIFPRTWKKELEELRIKHRKLGLKDTLFYQSAYLKKMGIKPKLGRPRKTDILKIIKTT